MISGIYCILNLITGDDYIGSSEDIPSRFSAHRWLLNSNKHHSIYLQRAWNKYGGEAFIFFIIEKITESILATEQIYLDKEKPSYNMSPLATRPVKKTIEIHQYSSDGNYLKSFNGIREASRILNTSSGKLTDVLKGRKRSAAGYLWSYIKYNKITPKPVTNKKAVIQYDLENNIVNKFSSIAEAGRKTTASLQNISRCIKGYRKTSGGYKWGWA